MLDRRAWGRVWTRQLPKDSVRMPDLTARGAMLQLTGRSSCLVKHRGHQENDRTFSVIDKPSPPLIGASPPEVPAFFRWLADLPDCTILPESIKAK